MPDPTPSRRTSPLIELLEADKPIFSLWINYYGVGSDYQTAVAAQDNPYFDFLLYDLEHQPYDLGLLKRFLWDLLDPAALAAKGRGAIKPVIPRLPPNGRELNEWVIKQVLDTGVAGIMVPHIETPEQALNVVAAARYAQKPGARDFAPEGKRGYSPAVPARYWGLHPDKSPSFPTSGASTPAASCCSSSLSRASSASTTCARSRTRSGRPAFAASSGRAAATCRFRTANPSTAEHSRPLEPESTPSSLPDANSGSPSG
jgi:hypothetical protein